MPGSKQFYIPTPCKLNGKMHILTSSMKQRRGFAKFLDNRLIKTRNVSLRPVATPEESIQGKTEKNYYMPFNKYLLSNHVLGNMLDNGDKKLNKILVSALKELKNLFLRMRTITSYICTILYSLQSIVTCCKFTALLLNIETINKYKEV